MRRKKAKDAPNVVADIFSIKTQPVDVLFDFGDTYSFISVKLAEKLGLVPISRPALHFVTFPNRKTVKCAELHEDCPIQMYEHVFLADLYKFELTNFVVILRMD